jgi:hypothetical protein
MLKKIHLANWQLVCRPKKLGGLGVIDLKIMNQALLLKWYWQWIKKDKKLWKEAFNSMDIFFNLQSIQRLRPFMKQLKSLFPFYQYSILRTIGNGENILLVS